MKKRDQIVAMADAAQEAQLRERLSELEAENAGLRRLDETIRRNARLVQALLDKSHDGVTLVNSEMTILRNVHSVLGNNEDDLAGRSVLAFIHPGDQALVQQAFTDLRNNPAQAVSYKCRVLDREGQWRWMEVEMTDMLDDSDIQAIVLNNRRVIERIKDDAAAQEPEPQSTPGASPSDAQ